MPKSKSDLEQEVRQGQHAQRILDDELFKDAIQKVRDEATKALTAPGTTKDIDALLQARLEYDAAEKVINAIFEHVRNAEYAAHKLQE